MYEEKGATTRSIYIGNKLQQTKLEAKEERRTLFSTVREWWATESLSSRSKLYSLDVWRGSCWRITCRSRGTATQCRHSLSVELGRSVTCLAAASTVKQRACISTYAKARSWFCCNAPVVARLAWKWDGWRNTTITRPITAVSSQMPSW